MSEWTVSGTETVVHDPFLKRKPSLIGADRDVDILNDVLQRVGVDDDDDPVPSHFVSPTKAGANHGRHHRDSIGDSPIVETGVAPLNPADLTPSKDPLEGFNAWIRGQQPTPGSHGQSPTPPGASPFAVGGGGVGGGVGGGGFGPFAGASPGHPGAGYQQRPLNFTPQKPTYGMRPDLPHGAGVFGNTTPTRVQQALLPNGTPMQLGTPTSPSYGPGPHDQGHMQGGGGYGAYSAYGYGMYSPGTMGGMTEEQRMYDMYGGPMTVETIRGRVYDTAKDQHGCRFLQRLLDSTYDGGEMTQMIMMEIVPHVAELMTDQYANFLVQKLFDIMPQDVRFRVAEVAAPYMSQIALTPHGTFSIQKMIETIATREEMEIVQQSLAKDVVELVKDVHGNHVIQKVLQRFEHDDKQFIYDAMASDCVPIATNKQGCCVLQRCLEFASPDQRLMLVRAVVESSQLLVQDPFGNYVVQYVLEANEMAINDAIAKVLLPNFMPLCMNKFSSNVIEKILRLISPPVRDEFIGQLKDLNVLSHLLQDDYGNYVVQTSLNIAPPLQADQLVQLIRPQMHLIRNAPYAKKLEAKMDLVARKQRGNAMRHSLSSGGLSNRSGDGIGNSPLSHGSPAHHSPVTQSPSYTREHGHPVGGLPSSAVHSNAPSPGGVPHGGGGMTPNRYERGPAMRGGGFAHQDPVRAQQAPAALQPQHFSSHAHHPPAVQQHQPSPLTQTTPPSSQPHAVPHAQPPGSAVTQPSPQSHRNSNNQRQPPHSQDNNGHVAVERTPTRHEKQAAPMQQPQPQPQQQQHHETRGRGGNNHGQQQQQQQQQQSQQSAPRGGGNGGSGGGGRAGGGSTPNKANRRH
jgi:hypothetical protein